MGINRVKYRGGKTRIEVRKRWPDGSEFRRFYPNKTKAERALTRINNSILEGKWQEEKAKRTGTPEASDDLQNPKEVTVEEFSAEFLEHCTVTAPKSWKRYELSFRSINAQLGHIRLRDFRREQLHEFRDQRVLEVSRGTVNRDVACLRSMFSFAIVKELIDADPLAKFSGLRVDKITRPLLSIEDYRRLVGGMDRLPISAMTAMMGETGMRKGEALFLKHEHVNVRDKVVALEHTKNGEVRYVPLSNYALSWYSKLTRYVRCPFVFVNPNTNERWVNPEQTFKRGAENAGLAWVGFHDLRRFRACQWIRLGLDVETVMKLLGHADLRTTERYIRGLEPHLNRVRELQSQEEQLLAVSASG